MFVWLWLGQLNRSLVDAEGGELVDDEEVVVADVLVGVVVQSLLFCSIAIFMPRIMLCNIG